MGASSVFDRPGAAFVRDYDANPPGAEHDFFSICNAIAAGGGLGCALGENPIDCAWHQITLSLQPASNDNIGTALGTLQTILPADGNSSGSQIRVTAVGTSNGTMAFALYVPPPDFSRGGTDDTAPSRSVVLTATSSATALNCQTNITIWRPPVLEVHGIWAGPTSWKTFETLLVQNSISGGDLTYAQALRYNDSLSGQISSTVPPYSGLSGSQLDKANFASIGLVPNAITVDVEARHNITAYKNFRDAAMVQADFVAHSLGGVVTRTLENQPFLAHDWNTFGQGIVHKLITIASPHLGTPLATALLDESAPCVRNKLALAGKFSFQSVTLNDGAVLEGAAGDAEGAGTGNGALSQALVELQASDNGIEVPTAMLAGEMTNNASGLDTSFLLWLLKNMPFMACSGDPLIQDFTSAQYPILMGGNSDGIIPTTSQQNGEPGFPVVTGVIHTNAIEALGFSGPGELQVDQSPSNMFLIDVIQLLNTASSSSCAQGSCMSPFYSLP